MGAVDSAAASGAAPAGSTVLGDSAASAPASLGATSLPVLLDASLVQDEASQIDWVVQTAEDGTVRTVVLDVPSRADILALWGLSDNVSSPDAQEAGTDADADSLDAADKAQTDRLVAALIALVSPSRAGEPPAPTRTPGTETTAKQVVTQWADNNIGSRPSTEAVSPTLAFTLYDAEGDVMHVDGDGLIVPSGGTEAKDLPATPENVKKYLGMDAAPSARTRQSAVNTYVSTADVLPTTVVQTTWVQDEDDNGPIYDPETGNPVYVSKNTTYRVEWSMTDTAVYAGYQRNAASYGEDAADTQYLQLLSEESFRIVGKVGDDTLEELGKSTSGYLYVDVVVNNQVRASYEFDDLMADGGNSQAQAGIGGSFDWLPDEGACSGMLLADLPQYTVTGEPIEYRIVCRGLVADDDYYAVSYDNSASANHGAVVDAAYEGGTVVFTHTGATTFTAYKQWFDGGNAARRDEVTFSLWRYSDGSTPGSIENSSQVRAADGSFITLVATPGDADENGRVDLGALLKEQYPDLVLDKYDSDGYPFVYGVREDTAVENYTVKFDGTVPNYYNVAADATISYTDQNRDPNSTAAAWTRPANDRLTYNGGTVENHLSGTKEVTQLKTWSVAAFQDQLQEVQCTFTLQRYNQGAGTWTAVLDAEGAPITQTIEGFNAETLTQEIAGAYPKYDDSGYEITYRWVETGVAQEGHTAEETRFERDEDANTAEFTLYLHALEGSADEAEAVRFTSSVDEDGTIVNAFDNATYENVEKLWQQPDGTYARQQPDETRTDTVTVRVYQNTTLVGEFLLDGEADAEATPFDDRIQGDAGSEPTVAQETSPYYLEITGLPQYSATGAKYVYRVVEDEPAGWDSERTYDAENHLTTITNSYGPGEGTDFHLLKEWTDGDDSAHRLTCYVTVRAARELTSRNGSVHYDAGEIIQADIELSEANAWFYELVVPVDNLTTDDVLIEETCLDASDGSERFEVYTRTEAEEAGLGNEDWVNVGWTNDLERVATHEHAYEVTYAAEAVGPFGEQTLTVNNRRIGLIDLTVEKEWVDGSAAPDDRPAAELVLRVDDSEARFFVEGGNAYAQLAGGNKIPLYDRDGAPLDSARVEDGGTALVVPVSPDSDASTYGFFGLPKYKGIASDGEVVHYTVEERFVDQRGQGDYVISSTAGDYLIGERHFHDEQTYRIANRRAGTTEVTFYKEWNDVYVNEALQRPDIALTLYQVSAETNEKPQPVEGYVHYLWQAASDEEEPVFGTSGSTTLAASQYLQSCTIDGLPKYDVLGDEITYYAVEGFMNDGTSLGYGDVTFSADRMTDPADPADPQLVEVASGNAADIDNSAGTAYAVRSGGTFVNSLTGTIVANGTKLWSNLPGSVQSADIPEITVFLQRKLATDDEWPDLYVRQDATGAWVPAGNADGSVGAVAWTSRMEQASDDSNRYTYSIASPGDNTNGSSGETLPAFDEDGNLYQYRAREVMVGLLDTPGYLQTDDVANVNFAQDTYVDGTGQVYDIRHGQTGSFYINNVYDATKGSLTVKKLFGGRDVGDAYPDVEFVLYRQYEGERGLSSPERVAAGAITAEELKQAEADGTDATYTFEGLELYAPNGAYWRYYVVEASIDGYATQVGLGDLALGAAEFGDGAVDDEGVASPPAVKDDGTSMVVAATSGDDGAPVYDTAVDVTFANTYEADALKLTGTKTWTDYGNAFGMRPDDIRLTLSRTSASGQEEASVPLQSDDPDAGNYLEWTQKGAHDASWTYAISNLEQWASDGSAWTYTIVETLPDGTTHYRTHVGTAEASGEATETEGAYEGAFGNLDNYLKGSVTVNKAWEDADDAWGLRPKSIEVQLQARYKALNATEDGYSAWMSAADAFAQLLNEVPSGFPSVEQTLGPGNAGGAWSYTWSSVPVRVKGDNGAIYTVEYRVVETKVGGEEATFDPANDLGASIVYDTTASYNGQQQTTWDDNEASASLAASSSTRITNTLDATELTVRKTWDDNDNEWGLRDIVYDQYRNERWSVTYKLQRSSDHGTTWDWVTDGEGQVVTASITGSMDAQDATFGSSTATFANLPAQDGDGNAYRYRAVEVVPGGYDVENPLVGAPLEEGDALVAGDSGQAVASDGAHQTYVNSLYTIGLSGTKAWEDYGTGFAPAFDQDGDGVIDRAPDMKLYRTTGDPADQGAQWEEARTVDGSMPQPAWSKGTDSTWTWTYSGLPRADGSGNAYTYRASETPGSIPGFYPAYAGGSTEVGADGDQTGDGITNTATRFALDKVNDWDVDPDAEGMQGEQLDGIELAVTSRDGRTTYAVWQRDEQGQVTTWTNPSGVATDEVWPNGTGNGQADTAKLTRMTGAAATYVIGLAAGDYLVRETGAVPQDHVRAEDVPFALAADGTVSSDVDGAVSQDGGVACVTAVDPVFRGYFTFAKALADDATSPVQGATFDLYRVGTAAGGGDELMAQGLTSGADGSFASADSDIALVGQTDGRRAALSDGLQAGEYYLMEVRTSDEAHLPSGDAAKFAFTLDAVANHGKAHAVTVQDNAAAEPGSQPAPVLLNDPFKATVTLFKHDAESGEGISEVEFRLTYTPADGGAPATTTPRTNAEGMLVLELSGKGSYELTETANEGYVVDTGFKATFTLDDEDHDGEFDLADADDRAAIEAVVEGDGMQQGTGLANTRLTGSASFKKESSADGAALDGAAFALQRQRVDATWEDVATGLATGKAYVLDAAGGATEDDSVMPEAGVLRVSGLPWGTYRFVETVPAGGFAGQVGNDPVTSDAFVVARDTVEAEAVLQDVENRPTQLVLRKTNEDGSAALPDVRFTVTPTGASTFADGTTGAKELTTGADGTASLEGQLCVGATYDIAETAAPAGYELAGESLRVTVQADGSLAAADGVSAPWSLDGSAATVSLADEPIRAFVKKVNANDETQALSGVTFDVVGAFADGAASKSVETGADGTVLIEGLVAGNRYQVTETGVPAGYTRIAGTFAFDVRADGTLVPAGDMVGYRVDADGVTVVAADVPTRLVVEKVAEDGALLPGARFTVTPTGASTFADGTTGAKELTTGADGTASLEGQLCVGATYDIAETAAPAGYELIAGTLSIRVAEDGAIEATGVVPNGYEKGDANTFTVRAVNTPVVVGLQKVSTDDYATPLAGAEFVVTGAFADGSTEQCLTTDDGGLVNLEALLVAGETYTIVEVRAADGHEIAADPFSFVMAADGSMTAAAGSVEAGAEEPGYQIADGGVIALTMADAPIKAKIMKTNRDGEPLAGAVFEIVPHDGSDAKTFTSGADGTVEIDAAWLVAGASYTISEVSAPTGHELAGSATFTVNDDGTLSFDGADAAGSVAGKEGSGLYTAAEDVDGTAVVSVKDDLIRVSLIKRDAAGNALAGAEFAVQGRFPDGDAEKTFSSDDTGVLFQDYVLLGSEDGERYLIRETQAPAGYELLGDVVLRVHDDGTVVVDDETPEGVRDAVSIDQVGGTAVVTVEDAAIEVGLRKVSENGKALAGAEFKVTGMFADGTTEKTLASAQDGTATLASLIAGASYTITEQKAPDGHKRIEEGYTFTVGSDGTLAGEAGAGYAIVDDGLVLQVTNEEIPPATLLSKTGDGQGPIVVLLGVAAALSSAACAGAVHRLRRCWEYPSGA